MDVRTLILGDWHPWLCDPIDLARYAFVVSAVVFVALGSGGSLGLAAASLAVLGVRWLQLPRPYDAAFVVALTLTGWGEALRLYDVFANYDLVVHLIVPVFASQVCYVTMARADLVPDPADDTTKLHYAGIFLVTVAFGLALGAIWELLEWLSDSWFASSLQLGQEDTMSDLLADLGGSVVGAALLVVWTVYGWGTVRRAPPGASPRQLAAAQEAGARD